MPYIKIDDIQKVVHPGIPRPAGDPFSPVFYYDRNKKTAMLGNPVDVAPWLKENWILAAIAGGAVLWGFRENERRKRYNRAHPQAPLGFLDWVFFRPVG